MTPRQVLDKVRKAGILSAAEVRVLEAAVLTKRERGKAAKLTVLVRALRLQETMTKEEAVDQAVREFPGVMTESYLTDCLNSSRTATADRLRLASCLVDFTDQGAEPGADA